MGGVANKVTEPPTQTVIVVAVIAGGSGAPAFGILTFVVKIQRDTASCIETG
jgi:hypothetical protein